MHLLAHSNGNPRNSEGAFITLSDGRILFAYTRYNGDSWQDHANADIYGVISEDEGETWSEPACIIPNTARNVMSVSFTRLQSGAIAMLYLQKKNVETGHVDCRPMLCTSQDEGQSWSDARDILGTPPAYHVVHNDRMVRLSNGRLIIPASLHRYGGNQGIGIFFLSDDDGATWRESRTCCYPPSWQLAGLMEPGVVELSDHRLLCWYRTTTRCQYKCFSYDQGESWTEPVPAPEFQSPSSPLSMKKHPETGDLIAIWNDYSPLRSVCFDESVPGRTPLVLARSRDDGATWVDHQVLEDKPDHGYAYTAMQFISGNRLLLAYCCGGKPTCTCMLQDLCIRTVSL